MSKTTKSGCTKCGGIILADTEDWENPLCHAHWVDLGEPEVEPNDTERIKKQNDNWIHGTCVKCGEAFLFWKDATGKRCNECEREGIVHPEPTSSIEYKNLFNKYQDLLAKHERVLQALMVAAKRSTYEWSKGPDYFPSDYANEGRIALANEILEQTKETKNG